MIKGVYLNEMIDDCSEPIRIQKEVFGKEYKEEVPGNNAQMPVMYILLYGEKMTPVGSVGMTFGLDGTVLFSQLAVLPEERCQGYGDFLMHMIFDKCQMGNVSTLKSFDVSQCPEYFNKYGFEVNDQYMTLDIPHYYATHQCKH